MKLWNYWTEIQLLTLSLFGWELLFLWSWTLGHSNQHGCRPGFSSRGHIGGIGSGLLRRIWHFLQVSTWEHSHITIRFQTKSEFPADRYILKVCFHCGVKPHKWKSARDLCTVSSVSVPSEIPERFGVRETHSNKNCNRTMTMISIYLYNSQIVSNRFKQCRSADHPSNGPTETRRFSRLFRTASRFSWASVQLGRSSKDRSNSISARRLTRNWRLEILQNKSF